MTGPNVTIVHGIVREATTRGIKLRGDDSTLIYQDRQMAESGARVGDFIRARVERTERGLIVRGLEIPEDDPERTCSICDAECSGYH